MKTAEEIFLQNLQITKYPTHKIALYAKDIVSLIQQGIDEAQNGSHKIDKDWIFEILDKTNNFAKQLIKEHFQRNCNHRWFARTDGGMHCMRCDKEY
jgi:hypothetical protein